MRLRRCPLLPCLLLLVAVPAGACSVSTLPLVFGSYRVFEAGDLTGTGTISVDCNSPYTLSLSAGAHGSGFAPRQLAAGSGRLDYWLYTDASHSLVWGDGSSGTATVGGPGGATPVDHPVYGRIPARQNVAVGSYSDTVVVTLEW